MIPLRWVEIDKSDTYPDEFPWMDEPESALSFTSQLALLQVVNWYSLSGSQFIVATHSPILLAFLDATIWHLDQDGMRTVTWDTAPPVTDLRASWTIVTFIYIICSVSVEISPGRR